MINIKIFKFFIQVLLVVCFIVSLFNITISIEKYNNSKKVYEEVVSKKEETNLYDINQDYMGWINIENTPVNYPIVKSNDNEFYLTRGFNKEYLISGSIFMDYRNKGFEDKNIVIYGHNMKDLSMFGSLKKYKNLDYLKDNKYITISNKENEIFKYEIFSAYVTDAYDLEAVSTNFNTKEHFIKYINKIYEKSIHDLNIDTKIIDKILTLLTCSNESNDSRLVIHAKLME